MSDDQASTAVSWLGIETNAAIGSALRNRIMRSWRSPGVGILTLLSTELVDTRHYSIAVHLYCEATMCLSCLLMVSLLGALFTSSGMYLLRVDMTACRPGAGTAPASCGSDDHQRPGTERRLVFLPGEHELGALNI